MPDDDALLRVALHVDDGVDVNAPFVFLEALHAHLHRVGYLLVVVEQYLLADNLRHEEAGRLVGQLVLVEVGRTFGQQFPDAFQQHVRAKLVLRRNGQNLGLGQQRVPLLHNRSQRSITTSSAFSLLPSTKLVNLVNQQQHGNLHLLHLLQEVHVLFRVLHHVGHVEQHVRILQGRFRESQHRLLQLVVGLQHTRGVAEHYLHVVCVDDAHDAMARRLGLERCYGNALSYQLVHERTLTHVGISNDVYKSGLVFLFFHVELSLYCLIGCKGTTNI